MKPCSLSCALSAIVAIAQAACVDKATLGNPNVANQVVMTSSNEVDILFVIDNSASMLEEQQTIIVAAKQAVLELKRSNGGMPSLHIGVVSTDMGTANGNAVSACAGAGDNGRLRTNGVPLSLHGQAETFLRDEPTGAGGAAGAGARVTNYQGILEDRLAEMLALGTNGCGFEQPLAAAARALAAPENVGWRRPTAKLAVVFLTDEDDCSLQPGGALLANDATLGPLDSYRCFRFGVTCDQTTSRPGAKSNCVADEDSAYLASSKALIDEIVDHARAPGLVRFTLIAPPPGPTNVGLGPQGSPVLEPSCASPNGTGAPAIRLTQAIANSGADVKLHSICDSDYTTAMRDTLNQTNCLNHPGLVDTDDAPGMQPQCTVVRESAAGSTAVIACGQGVADCFVIKQDADACPTTPGNLAMDFTQPAKLGEAVIVSCLAATN